MVRAIGRWLSWLPVLLASGCIGTLVPAPGSHSFGLPGHGALRAGTSLGRAGAGYVAARPDGEERWGMPALVGALERAFASVEERFPGTPPLRVGDLSARGGGHLTHHASHRSGRDADLIFYALDARGEPAQGRGWLAYDRFGIARAPSGTGPGAAPGDAIFFFDAARNWQLVRSLLADQSVLVQWIFCSNGVKSVLLRYAIDHEPDPAILLHAATVLHQPSNGRPHDDHFHVRVLCGPAERAGGCGENGPIWPWLRERVEKVEALDPVAYDDATLVDWLMNEPAADTVAAGTS
jgi:penicillin-insensitive murein endopeptidase